MQLFNFVTKIVNQNLPLPLIIVSNGVFIEARPQLNDRDVFHNF